ncbi:MAG: NAD(+)/NADH kinase [Woeseiaceae bacterium]
MGITIKRVAILGRHQDPHVAELMQTLVAHLTKAGVKVFGSDDLDLDLAIERVPEKDLAANADLMIAVGGDGTMLYAGHLLLESGVPLLGVNRGRLGFLADVSPDAMLDSVDHILQGNSSTETRIQLTANLQRANGESITATAINDVVLQRYETGRMVDMITSVDGQRLNTQSGDGLIVATPTGSTAYALSCGGPLIDPRLDVVVVVPICPHTLTVRPIVIPAHQTISVRVLQRQDTKAEVVIDGNSIGTIGPDDELTIQQSQHRTHLIHPPDYDFYSILRSKLFWGRDNRDRGQEAS